MEEIKEIFGLIGSYGFPIAVTVYLLWERATTIKENTKTMSQLTNAITLLSEYIKGGKE